MSPAQARRHEFRTALFSQRGCESATAWADRLLVRDAEKDDRRICLECAQLMRTGRCAAKMRNTAPKHEPVTTILQRCDYFSWQLPQGQA